MKRIFLTLLALAFIFPFAVTALAHGEPSHDENIKQVTEKFRNGNSIASNIDGHHGTVVETQPNYKVLGTFGAVNLSFILIGVWNKWSRRREKLYGNT